MRISDWSSDVCSSDFYRLSTWADRDVQAVAGSGDFSNLEQAESYVEALRRSAEESAPARLQFGARTIGYSLFPNLSGHGWGEERTSVVSGKSGSVREDLGGRRLIKKKTKKNKY